MSSEAASAPNTNWLKPINSPIDATIDIVAVHGINLTNNPDHGDHTWTDKKSGTNWLRDLLPSRVPKSRIFAYQYNANVAFGTSVAGVEEQAKNLLTCLWLKRKANNARPIIFIAHSMGGIIVKQALATAYHGDGTYAMISTFTYGIVFFGVPHRGSKVAAQGSNAARAIEMCPMQLNKSFLNSVAWGSQYNAILNTKFEPLLERYKIFSFCESLPEQIRGMNLGIIVRGDSAVLGLPDRQECTIFFNRSHTTICKFASGDEREWQQTSDILCDAAECAVKAFSYSPTILQHKERFQDLSWYVEDTQERVIPGPQAVEQAEKVLASLVEGSKDRTQLNDIQGEVSSLNYGLISLASWFLAAALLPILVFVPVMISALLLPPKVTIMDKFEDARRSQQAVVELEQLSIETRDIQLRRVLQAVDMLRRVSNFEDPQNANNMDAGQSELALQLHLALDEQAERIVDELHHHHQAYYKAKTRYNLIEQGQQEAEGKDEGQLVIWLGEKAQQAKAKAEEEDRREEEGGSSGSCSCLWP